MPHTASKCFDDADFAGLLLKRFRTFLIKNRREGALGPIEPILERQIERTLLPSLALAICEGGEDQRAFESSGKPCLKEDPIGTEDPILIPALKSIIAESKSAIAGYDERLNRKKRTICLILIRNFQKTIDA